MFSYEEIHNAYLDCRRRKRGTSNALRFEINQAVNLFDICDQLNNGDYSPSRSVCFVTANPKPREVFAADFRDRILHHLLIREIEPYWEKIFIHDSFACRKGKGTHAAVERLAAFARKATKGGRKRIWFLQLDICNFFMSIDKKILWELVCKGLDRQFDVTIRQLPLFDGTVSRYRELRRLAEIFVRHDPTDSYVKKGPDANWAILPSNKRLFSCGPGKGLPIGNLTSQFFANVYLNELDQYVKHVLKTRYYIRYVDDVILLDESKERLQEWLASIQEFLSKRLCVALNEKAIFLKPVSCGINFLGYIVHPAHKLVRRRVIGNFRSGLERFRKQLKVDQGRICYPYGILEKLLAMLNSYLAHLKRASTHRLLRALLEKHAWLSHYFKIEDGKAERTWLPPREFPRLARQYFWFRRRYPNTLIFFQIGRFFELYARDAVWAAKRLGLNTLRPRFRGLSRAGVPAMMIDQFINKTTSSGMSVLKVSETGYPLSRVKERFPEELIIA